eukprot:Clim_evm4s206 gene=Clim_evmTU4s206
MEFARLPELNITFHCAMEENIVSMLDKIFSHQTNGARDREYETTVTAVILFKSIGDGRQEEIVKLKEPQRLLWSCISPPTLFLMVKSNNMHAIRLFLIVLVAGALSQNLTAVPTVHETAVEYAPFDGWYINPYHPGYGGAETTTVRLSPPTYSDGTYRIVETSDDASVPNTRPNPRAISSTTMGGPSGLKSDQQLTVLFTHFGQQLAEEMLDMQRPLCAPEYLFQPITQETFDLEGNLPVGYVIAAARSRYDFGTGFGPQTPRTQINEISAYFDGTLIYGPFKAWADELRTLEGGTMLNGELEGNAIGNDVQDGNPDQLGYPPKNFKGLPFANPPPPVSGLENPDKGFMSVSRYFMMGNPRGNEVPMVTGLGIMLHRLHNRIATTYVAPLIDSNDALAAELAEVRTSRGEESFRRLRDDIIYNHARALTIGIYQKVAYREWLPLLVGQTVEEIEERYPYEGFDPDINPGISLEFQSAAMRFGHSLVTPGVWRRVPAALGASNPELLQQALTGNANKSIQLSERYTAEQLQCPGSTSFFVDPIRTCRTYFNVEQFVEEYGADSLVLGMASQRAEREDNIVTEDLRGFVVGPLESARRDLMVLNINRGRDHGLPSYNVVRQSLGLAPRTFEEILPDTVPNREQLLQNLTDVHGGDINRMDLWTGGLLEADGSMGETFREIILNQFIRSRDGDRFYYENPNGLYTDEDRAFIEEWDIRRIILEVFPRISDADLAPNPFLITNNPCPEPEDINGDLLSQDNLNSMNMSCPFSIEDATFDYYSTSDYFVWYLVAFLVGWTLLMIALAVLGRSYHQHKKDHIQRPTGIVYTASKERETFKVQMVGAPGFATAKDPMYDVQWAPIVLGLDKEGIWMYEGYNAAQSNLVAFRPWSMIASMEIVDTPGVGQYLRVICHHPHMHGDMLFCLRTYKHEYRVMSPQAFMNYLADRKDTNEIQASDLMRFRDVALQYGSLTMRTVRGGELAEMVSNGTTLNNCFRRAGKLYKSIQEIVAKSHELQGNTACNTIANELDPENADLFAHLTLTAPDWCALQGSDFDDVLMKRFLNAFGRDYRTGSYHSVPTNRRAMDGRSMVMISLLASEGIYKEESENAFWTIYGQSAGEGIGIKEMLSLLAVLFPAHFEADGAKMLQFAGIDAKKTTWNSVSEISDTLAHCRAYVKNPSGSMRRAVFDDRSASLIARNSVHKPARKPRGAAKPGLDVIAEDDNITEQPHKASFFKRLSIRPKPQGGDEEPRLHDSTTLGQWKSVRGNIERVAGNEVEFDWEYEDKDVLEGDMVERNKFTLRVRNLAHKYRLRIFWTYAFLISTVLIFWERFWFFKDERDVEGGLRYILGYGVSITRGAASAMMWAFSLLLLPMCRNLITYMSKSHLAQQILPLGDYIFFHKLFATTGLLTVCLHVGGHLFNAYNLNTQPRGALACYFRNYYWPSNMLTSYKWWVMDTVTGLSGVILTMQCLAFAAFSYKVIRNYAYPFFWAVHMTYPLFFFLLVLHGSARMVIGPIFGFFFIGPALIFILDRFIDISTKSDIRGVASVRFFSGEVIELKIKRADNFEYSAGQYLRIAVPTELGEEFHPFTISSAPHEPHVSIHVKALGPWTHRLHRAYSSNDPTAWPPVVLKGPYGDAAEIWDRQRTVVFVGSGIGVTPWASVLSEIGHRATTSPRMQVRKVHFILVARSLRGNSWFLEKLREAQAKAPPGFIDVSIFITRRTDLDAGATAMDIAKNQNRDDPDTVAKAAIADLHCSVTFGRPDWAGVLKTVQELHRGESIGVFTCAAPALSNSLTNSAKEVTKTDMATPIRVYDLGFA